MTGSVHSCSTDPGYVLFSAMVPSLIMTGSVHSCSTDPGYVLYSAMFFL
jgi:hypothetical protein